MTIIYRHRWKDNIKMALKDQICEDVGWNQLAQKRN